MIIEGKYLKMDGIVRPLLRVILKLKNTFYSSFFLIDTGADRTFLPYSMISQFDIDLKDIEVKEDISGVGGPAPYFTYMTELLIGDGEKFKIFKGEVGIFLDPHSAPFPILGRDILDNFKLIFDREKCKIYLLDERHTYEIKEVI